MFVNRAKVSETNKTALNYFDYRDTPSDLTKRVFMTKMIPPVPTSAVMMPTPKQKIGFSIESIVGNDANNTNNTSITNNDATVTATTALSQNSEDNNASSAQQPTSPPQTPPACVTSLAGLHHSHNILAQHPHMAQHLSLAQQQALHHHIIMQQQQHQQQLQQTGNHPKPDITDILQRLHNTAQAAHLNAANGPFSPTLHTRLSPEQDSSGMTVQQQQPHQHPLKRERSPEPVIESGPNPAQRHQPPHTPPKSVSPQSSTHNSPPPPNVQTAAAHLHLSSSTPNQHYNKPLGNTLTPNGLPLMVPGLPPNNIVRPFPLGAGQAPPPGPPNQPGMPDIKALPPYINAPPELPPQHNPHLIAAAQFQMALQAGHVLGPAAAAAAAAGLPPHAGPFMTAPGLPRDSYPLYPWLLSRHGRIFPHRFPGSKYIGHTNFNKILISSQPHLKL